MPRVKIFIAAALSILLLIIVVQNTEVVTITLLLWSFEMSRVILILVATMTGFMTGYVVARVTSPSSSSLRESSPGGGVPRP